MGLRHSLYLGDLSRITQVFLAAVCFYFIWMDVILYNRIQEVPPLRLPPHLINLTSSSMPSAVASPPIAGSPAGSSQSLGPESQEKEKTTSIFSPFAGLSVKLMMMDHLNHYVENPIALSITKVSHLDSQFLWLTPNWLSFLGMVAACVATRFISWDGRVWHLAAVVLMLGRGLADALDGLVARERRGIIRHVSIHNTTGYFVDAIADTLGYSAFLLGCFAYLRRNIPKQYQPLPVLYQSEEKPKRKCDSPVPNGTQWTSQRIFLVVFCLGMQVAASAALWDHYCDSYHQLLETPMASEPQAIVQNEVLKSTLMWLVIWLWRISNSHALINWLLFAILANKMWEFLVFIQFIGFAEIVTLFLFTEIHFRDVTAYINMVP